MSVSSLELVLVHVVSRPVCTKHPDPTAGRPLVSDKPVYFMSCRGVEADSKISRLFFVDFCRRSFDFCSRPYIYFESKGQRPVEHLHKLVKIHQKY